MKKNSTQGVYKTRKKHYRILKNPKNRRESQHSRGLSPLHKRSKNQSLKLQHTSLHPLKTPSISLPPKTLENTKRDHIPYLPDPSISAPTTPAR